MRGQLSIFRAAGQGRIIQRVGIPPRKAGQPPKKLGETRGNWETKDTSHISLPKNGEVSPIIRETPRSATHSFGCPAL